MIHDKLCDFVYSLRAHDEKDDTTDILDTLAKAPLPIRRLIVHALRVLNAHGRMPRDIEAGDPYNSTVFVSNLGSIKLNAGYHHLTNWGTNSVFVVIGEKHPHPYYDAEGKVTMRSSLSLGITLDERIADGYYFSRTIQLLRHLLQHPELLDTKAKEALDIAY